MDILIITVSFLSGLACGAGGAFLVLKLVKPDVSKIILRYDDIVLPELSIVRGDYVRFPYSGEAGGGDRDPRRRG